MRRPDTKEDIRSLPALAVTIVLCAPETAVRDKRKACVTKIIIKNVCKLEALRFAFHFVSETLGLSTQHLTDENILYIESCHLLRDTITVLRKMNCNA